MSSIYVIFAVFVFCMGNAFPAGRGPKGASASTPLSEVVRAINTQMTADTILLRQTSNAVVYLADSGFIDDLIVTGTVYPYGGIISKNGVYSISGTNGQTVIGNALTVQKLLGSNPVCTPFGSPASDGQTPVSMCWSPNRQYVAVADLYGNILQIFSFLEGTLTPVGSVATNFKPTEVFWSPDGQYLAAVVFDQDNLDQGYLQVYSFSAGGPVLVGSIEVGYYPQSGCWSPDGQYIAVVNTGDGTLQVYSFDGGNLTKVGDDVFIGLLADPWSVSWSPEGQYIAVVNENGFSLQVYSFAGSTPVQVGEDASTGDASYPISVSWAPDGKSLAVVCSAANAFLRIFSFSGGTPVQVGPDLPTGGSPSRASWSPDGQYIVVVSNTDNTLSIFNFMGGIPAVLGSMPLVDFQVASTCSWSPDGQYIAVTSIDIFFGGSYVQIYSVNSALYTPVLTISGNTLGEGDLTITGSAQMGPTTINGTLMVNSSTVHIGANGYPGQPGGVGILVLGGSGGTGGSGGDGKLFLGSFGGAGGNGVLSIGAQYAVATKHSSSPADVSSLTYQLELSPTWTTTPLVSVNASVVSKSATVGISYSYNETFYIALKAGADPASILANGVSYNVYKNTSGEITKYTQQASLPTCSLSGNSLTVTLPAPSGGTAPYVTNIQVAGPVF